MLNIGYKTRLILALCLPLTLIGSLFVAFAHFPIRVFYGERSSALSMLNGVVQGLSTIVAIVFSIVILVLQATLGRYVTKTIRYLISDWVNVLMLSLYLTTIICALGTMWTIDHKTWNLWVDITMGATFFCIGALLPFFLRVPHSLNPGLIMRQMRDEILDSFYHIGRVGLSRIMSQIDSLFDVIDKCVETGDINPALEGIRLVRMMILQLYDDRLLNPMFLWDMMDYVLEICRKALRTELARARPLLFEGYDLAVEIYRYCVIHNSHMYVDEAFRKFLRLSRNAGFRVRLDLDLLMDTIMELLRINERGRALHVLGILLEEIPEDQLFKFHMLELVKDSKIGGFDQFASTSLKMMRKAFAKFDVDALAKDKSEEEVYLWIKKQLS